MQNLTRKIAEYAGLGALALGLCGGCATQNMLTNQQQESQYACFRQTESGENLHFKIGISEDKKKTKFSLEKISVSWGDHPSLVSQHDPDDKSLYVLETYGSNDTVMSKYSLGDGEGGLIYWDDFSGKEPRGGIIVLDEYTMDGTIPYQPGMRRIKVKHYEEGRTSFPVNLEKIINAERLREIESGRLERLKQKYEKSADTYRSYWEHSITDDYLKNISGSEKAFIEAFDNLPHEEQENLWREYKDILDILGSQHYARGEKHPLRDILKINDIQEELRKLEPVKIYPEEKTDKLPFGN